MEKALLPVGASVVYDAIMRTLEPRIWVAGPCPSRPAKLLPVPNCLEATENYVFNWFIPASSIFIIVVFEPDAWVEYLFTPLPKLLEALIMTSWARPFALLLKLKLDAALSDPPRPPNDPGALAVICGPLATLRGAALLAPIVRPTVAPAEGT